MIERVGVHGADHAKVIGHFRNVRQIIRETHAALAVLLELRGLASTAAFGLINASFRSLVIAGGSGLPCHFCSSGLGSNRSIWLGPPSMNRKMTFFALGAKCGFLGASGFGASAPCSKSASAIVPSRRRHSAERNAVRRYAQVQADSCLFPRDEFVEVEQHAAQPHPCRCFRRLGADRHRHQRLSGFWVRFEIRLLFVQIFREPLRVLANCGSRARHKRNAWSIRESASFRRIRSASACAASKKTGSFIRFSACSGVFDRVAGCRRRSNRARRSSSAADTAPCAGSGCTGRGGTGPAPVLSTHFPLP